MTAEALAAAQQSIVAKRFDEALRDLEPLLEAEPENTDALYMRAVCYRYKGEHAVALEVLRRGVDPADAYADEPASHTTSGGRVQA